MRRTEVLEGVRLMKFSGRFRPLSAAGVEQAGGGAAGGVSKRTFRRWCPRFEAEGEAGLHDRRLGLASAKRVRRMRRCPAYSPEARGRCERAFRTLQHRLPKELDLAGIIDVAS